MHLRINKLILTAITMVFVSCNNNKQPEEVNAEEVRSIEVVLNKNLETIGVVLVLSDLGDYILENYKSKDYTFVKLLRQEFANFKNHPVVLKANEMGELNLLQFGHFYYGLSYSDLPDFELRGARMEEFYYNDEIPKDSIDLVLTQFDSLIRIFYKEAKIEEFMEEHKDMYEGIQHEVRSIVPTNILSAMEQFFGESDGEYVICPSPTIFTGFNFGVRFSSDSRNTSYYVTGPAKDLIPRRTSLDTIEDSDSLGFSDVAYITEQAIHEFGHSFVRFLDKEENVNLWEQLASLNTETLRINLEDIGQNPSWQTGFEEHLVRACEIMIWRDLGDEKKAAEKLNYERDEEGMIYIDEFVKALENYQRNRENYKNLESYFPLLIADLGKIREEINPNN